MDDIAKQHSSQKHSETVTYVKDTFGLGLFFADLVVHKADRTDSGSFSDEELL